MALDLALKGSDFKARAVSPFHEMGAYETLWSERGTMFKSLSERFAQHLGSLPSHFVSPVAARECTVFVKHRLDQAKIEWFGVRVHGAGEYPEKLRDASHPVELFCISGLMGLGGLALGCRSGNSEAVWRGRQAHAPPRARARPC